MPNTLREALRAGLQASWRWDDLTDPTLMERVLDDMEPVVAAHIDALAAAVAALALYDPEARTMADAAESMRNRAVAIVRGADR